VNNSSFMPKKRYLASMISCLMAMQSQGLDFNPSNIETNINTELSLGSSWRTANQDATLIQADNSEDGNANFNKGDAFSQIFKGSHDLSVTYENFGGHLSGKYWYDSALKDNNVRRGHAPTATVGDGPGTPDFITYAGGGRLDDSGVNNLSKYSGAEIMKAYVYGSFDVSDMPLEVRLGRQVVSWGESTFIPGGVNSINPIDVNALKQPGAGLKDALMPVGMAYGNIGLTDTLSAEAFYMLEYQETVVPSCGTYFSFIDYLTEGCDVATVQGFGLKRAEDDGYRTPDADGQYGVAFRFIPEGLGDTEFGLYFMNIHSRAPIGSGVKGTMTDEEKGDAFALGGEDYVTSQVLSSTRYITEYVEDVQLFGLTFATTLNGYAVSGEVSHKQDMSVQINPSQLINATIAGTTQHLASEGLDSTILDDDLAAIAPGGAVDGYRLFDITQAQVTVVNFLDRMLGSDRYLFVAEAGLTYVHDLVEGDNQIRFGRSPAFDKEGDTDGFVTRSSWGYRAMLKGDYSDVFAGIALSPKMVWKHDVSGYAPKNSGLFSAGQKSLALALEADYLSTYHASIAYTQFLGGDYSVKRDRDFAAVSVGVSF